ncbi:MAG: acetyl-CoA carboxylase carboxyltransferase subunit alpha [Bryobacterales bacterium]|nr:acetyl-CoA carboxylase carboxyltransferase subunit alpha [Bryobacterales bacterium]MEB2363404.1 acetyl-CoA carboxylase carboxyltransferase subunit alpha [Bryobacterales bacterium]
MNDETRAQIEALEREIAGLRDRESGTEVRIGQLEEQLRALQEQPTEKHPSWQRVLLARHPKRPHSLDYIQRLFTDFQEIHGDRAFSDDPAIIAGLGFFEGKPVAVVGQQKGRDTRQKLFRNFGMPKPEGYRKALRVMQLAAKFQRPVITLLDTPGAYPGIDAEERGQAEAIAVNLREMSRLRVPIIVVVIGEGGSGGALALGVGNLVLMLENAVYSVISPESCAAIIWRDAGKAELAAAALRLTATDLEQLGLIDTVVPEPPGGAHEDHDAAAELLRANIRKSLETLSSQSPQELIDSRYRKFRNMGSFFMER